MRVSGAKRSNKGKGLGNATGSGICHSYTPDGRCVSLLKILLTNRCIYDCRYCVNRVSNDVQRAAFTVEEVVRLTIEFYRRNYIEGLFLSSGVVGDSDRTMDLLAEVARRLREDEEFHGYIHLKGVVGASDEALAKAGRHADRISANVELPVQEDLNKLAPEKSIEEAEGAMGFLKSGIDRSKERGRRARPPRFAPAGQSTQMIVGATASTDLDDPRDGQPPLRHLPAAAGVLHGLQSDSQRPPGPPAETPELVREHRLYQADWLLRFYEFGIEEVVTRDDGNLDLEVDPKMPGRSPTARSSPWTSTRHLARRCSASPGSGRVRWRRSSRRELGADCARRICASSALP